MNRQKHILSFICLALLLRLALFVAVAPWKPENFKNLVSNDSGHYEAMAHNILNGKLFTLTQHPGVSLIRTPGYPLLLAIVYGLFGNHRFLVILIQIILGVCSCYFTYKIGARLFSEKIGILSGYLMAVEYLSIVSCMTILVETIFAFLLLLAIIFWIRFLDSKSITDISLTGVIIGVGAFCKPAMLYLPVPLFMFYIFNGFQSQEDLNRRLKNTVIGIIFFLLPIAPWLARNAIVFGTPALSTIKGDHLMTVHATYLESALSGNDNIREVKKQMWQELRSKTKNKGLNQMQIASIMEEMAIEKIKANPFTFFKIHLLGMVALLISHGKNIVFQVLGFQNGWFGTNLHHLGSLSSFWNYEILPSVLGVWNMPFGGQKIVSIIMYFYQLIFVIGVIYGSSIIFWRNRNKWGMRLLMVIVGYFWVIGSPGASPRFKMMMMPFFTLLFSLSLYKWFSSECQTSPAGQM